MGIKTKEKYVELYCPNCKRLNIKINGEDANCDFCGWELNYSPTP